MKYDAIVVGGGQAGPPLAAFFANQGQSVALIEGYKIGGSCVNYGCTPTKALRAAARVAHQARRSSDYGIHTGNIVVDFAQVMARVHSIVAESRDGLTEWLESIDNLAIYWDYAAFIGTENGLHQMQVGDETIEAKRVYLNVGTRATVPPVAGLADVDYLDNVRLIEGLQSVPDHLLILGGGYIGIEMGQIFRRFGSEVTIIERSAHVVSREDDDVAQEIERMFTDAGITLLTNHTAKRTTQNETGITLYLEDGASGENKAITGSHLLVAAGRIPNTDKLNLDKVGVEMDEEGYIPTNGKLETNVPGIYALGDINGRGAFTHTSYHDFEIVRDNYQGAERSADDRPLAYAMFTDPPLGHVGMHEREARESGRDVLMMRHYAKNVSRAKEDGELDGLVKIIVDAQTEEILGATTLIMQGDDVVQVVSNFMAAGGSYKAMQRALPIHPTISEFFPTWLGMLEPLAKAEDT